MLKNCKQCDQQFEITDEDLKFYEKISPVFAEKRFPIPAPKLCPDCRQQRRLAMRNERTLYNRKCDLSGKQIVSVHSPNKPYKVYDQDEWWSDKWDPLDYGRDFDFSKTFTEQYKLLLIDVPQVSLTNVNTENSYYTNFAINQKNSYLIFGASNDEDCLFGKFVHGSKDCVDNYSIFNCELCYEGIASEKCYNCKFFINSRNCSDSIMIDDCQSCKNCIGCFGLKSKEYYFLNQYVGKEKFAEIQKEYSVLTPAKIDFLSKKLCELELKLPHLQSRIYASENCSGDTIFNSKNCHRAFDINGCEDCKYIYFSPKSQNTQDAAFNAPDGVKFCYNVCSTVGIESGIVTFYVWYGSNIYYSQSCHNSNDLFGCVGLKRKKYCIFNKQYSKENYEKLVSQIIEHMQKTGEWGEYFPFTLSSFDYNESIAQEYYPLTKEQALRLGASWYEEEQKGKYQGEIYKIPVDIMNVSDEICNKILTCEVSGKNYRIIPQELKFYRKMGLPVPHLCPDQRHVDRINKHNPLRLWDRKCAKCGAEIQTSYAPKRPEIVYCESCYLKEVY